MKLDPSPLADQAFRSHPDFIRPFADFVAKLVAETGPGPRHLLEVGCGDGSLLAALADRFPACALTGIDLSAESVRTARLRPASNRAPAAGIVVR